VIRADAAFEAIGRKETAEQALEITRKTVTVVLVGLYEELVQLDIMHILKKEI
jgi:threonine dehydrogenase-like Zn-dependent dehydrogenase